MNMHCKSTCNISRNYLNHTDYIAAVMQIRSYPTVHILLIGIIFENDVFYFNLFVVCNISCHFIIIVKVILSFVVKCKPHQST